METSHNKEINFQLQTLPRKTRKALEFFSDQQWLKKSDWYLAGGTALALFEGHRQSQDLDFFIPQKDFRLESVVNKMPNEWTTDTLREGTIYGRIFDAKVSFISLPLFHPKQPVINLGSVRILQPKDIAVMKIIAVSQRGRKRDFVDLYWYINHHEKLIDVMRRLPEQYPTVAHNYYHICSSLAYFVDAEDDVMPKLFFKANWRSIKLFFQKEAVWVTRELLELD